MGRRRVRRDRGVTLVEFAIAAPLIFLLIFGAIDFAWVFAQNVDLKNGAREGARLGAVNGGPTSSFDSAGDVVVAVRARTPELDGDDLAVSVQLLDDDSDGNLGERGETFVLCVRYPVRSLSGMTSIFLSGDMTSKVVMRHEKVATFESGTSENWPVGATCSP
jgi:hypothetical protein